MIMVQCLIKEREGQFEAGFEPTGSVSVDGGVGSGDWLEGFGAAGLKVKTMSRSVMYEI